MKSAISIFPSLMIALHAVPSCAWVPSKSAASNPSLATASRLARARGLSITALQAAASAVSRRQALQEALAGSSIAAAAAVFGPAKALAGEGDDSPPLPNGVTYTVSKRGDGPKPDMGELVAIRFAAYAGDLKIDDIFDSPEPYYTRIGSGPLIKGVEDALPFMRLGDRWVLTIPGNAAFGDKGRPASPGRPRIPPNAVVTFDVEMVGLPGKEPELIELIGDV